MVFNKHPDLNRFNPDEEKEKEEEDKSRRDMDGGLYFPQKKEPKLKPAPPAGSLFDIQDLS